MNNKELAEIKKNFNDDSGLFTLNRVATAFVDAEKNVSAKTNRLYSLIPEEECAVFMETLSKVFKGTLGKGLLAYEFPDEAYEDGGAQKQLYVAMKTKFTDEDVTDKLIARITENLAYDTAYALILGHCTYSIKSKDKNDEVAGDATDEYNFVVAAVCPANTSDDGLMFDREKGTIVKKSNTELIIDRTPTDGFFFPVFSERTPDVNSVMYYTKKPKEPNVSCINDVLGCEFTMSAATEKDTFQNILNEVVSDELNYSVITHVNDNLRALIAVSKNETELPTLDATKLHKILSEAGVSESKLETLSTVFANKAGTATLKVNNLVDDKTTVITSDVTVSVGKGASSKVRTTDTDGKRSLVIDLDDPTVAINGLYTHI